MTSSCTQHKNPLCRIEALETAHQEDDNNKGRTLNYDKEKYREDDNFISAETVLGIFGFDRPVYGDSKKRRGKWSQELIHEKRKRHSNRDDARERRRSVNLLCITSSSIWSNEDDIPQQLH